jgi:hypothetical protein
LPFENFVIASVTFVGLNQLAKCNNFVTLLYMELFVNPNFLQSSMFEQLFFKSPMTQQTVCFAAGGCVSGMSSLHVLH